MKPKEILFAFDIFLFEKHQCFSAIIIGGGALSLMGVIKRETQDIDILDPEVPENIAALAREFALQMTRSHKIPLKTDWLNNGPISLRNLLPSDWMKRRQVVFAGKALTLESLGRSDLLKTKLFAFCDRDQDRDDCIKLSPTPMELAEAFTWVEKQDQNPGWPVHVAVSFKELAKELGHDS